MIDLVHLQPYPKWKKFYLFFNLSQFGFSRNEDKMTFFNFFTLKKKIGNALARVRQKQYLEWNFFFHFSHPSLDKNESRMMFLNFLNFFTIVFFFIFLGLHQLRLGRYGTQKDNFFSFSACPSPVWLEINPKWRFFNFSIFLLFFWECTSLGRVEMIPRTIFFFLFYSLSRPNLATNEARMTFLNFLNFFGNAPCRVRQKRFLEQKIVYLFFDLSRPSLVRNKAKMMFF